MLQNCSLARHGLGIYMKKNFSIIIWVNGEKQQETWFNTCIYLYFNDVLLSIAGLIFNREFYGAINRIIKNICIYIASDIVIAVVN